MSYSFAEVIRISRPRFWLYTAGPFIIGSLLAINDYSDLLTFQFFYLLFYFVFPANLFLYGLNDLFDQDTDIINKKKNEKESKVTHKNIFLYKRSIYRAAVFTCTLFLLLSPLATMFLGIFLCLSFFYSAPPLRFKSRPLIDFLSNILYIIPGFIGYLILNPSINDLNVLLIISAWCWVGALHLFSAIPDIDVDKKANIHTTATVLGKTKSLLLCCALWSVSAILAICLHVILIPTLIYPLIPAVLLFKKNNDVERIYWLLPWVNSFMGFAIFMYLLSPFVEPKWLLIFPPLSMIFAISILLHKKFV